MQCRKLRRRVCHSFSLQARLAPRILVDLVVDRLPKMACYRGLRGEQPLAGFNRDLECS